MEARPGTTASAAQEDEHFHAVFEGAEVGMALVALGRGLQGRCMTANSTLAALLAMPVEELTSIPMTDFIHEDDHHAWNAMLDRVAAHQQTARLELHLRARGGKGFDALVDVSVALDDTGWWRCAIVQVVPAA